MSAIDVLREALALHNSMAESGERPSPRSMAALNQGFIALRRVEAVIEAAKDAVETQTWGSLEALAAALRDMDKEPAQPCPTCFTRRVAK